MELCSITGWLAQTQTDDPPHVFGDRFLRRMQRHPPHPTQAGRLPARPTGQPIENYAAVRDRANLQSDQDRILRLPRPRPTVSLTQRDLADVPDSATGKRRNGFLRRTVKDLGTMLTRLDTLGTATCLASVKTQRQSWQQIRP